VGAATTVICAAGLTSLSMTVAAGCALAGLVLASWFVVLMDGMDAPASKW
jgi:hypothetical protein